ncbi:hypothetical protein TNCV_5116601 [Trichonephila clavipes]|nr:hypothetical protein TNCV_5116601 [Trichonephila clavipes]
MVVVAELYRYRIVACLVTSSSPVQLKTFRVGQRCTREREREREGSLRWVAVGRLEAGRSQAEVAGWLQVARKWSLSYESNFKQVVRSPGRLTKVTTLLRQLHRNATGHSKRYR